MRIHEFSIFSHGSRGLFGKTCEEALDTPFFSFFADPRKRHILVFRISSLLRMFRDTQESQYGCQQVLSITPSDTAVMSEHTFLEPSPAVMSEHTFLEPSPASVPGVLGRATKNYLDLGVRGHLADA